MLRSVPVILVGIPVPGLFNTYLAVPSVCIEVSVSVRRGRECRLESPHLDDELRNLVEEFLRVLCRLRGDAIDVRIGLRNAVPRQLPVLGMYVALTNAILARVLGVYGHDLAKAARHVVEYVDSTIVEDLDPGAIMALRCADALLRPCIARGLEYIEARSPRLSFGFEVRERMEASYRIISAVSRELLSLILKLESLLVREALEAMSEGNHCKLQEILDFASALESRIAGIKASGRTMPTHRRGVVEVGQIWVEHGRS